MKRGSSFKNYHVSWHLSRSFWIACERQHSQRDGSKPKDATFPPTSIAQSNLASISKNKNCSPFKGGRRRRRSSQQPPDKTSMHKPILICFLPNVRPFNFLWTKPLVEIFIITNHLIQTPPIFQSFTITKINHNNRFNLCLIKMSWHIIHTYNQFRTKPRKMVNGRKIWARRYNSRNSLCKFTSTTNVWAKIKESQEQC